MVLSYSTKYAKENGDTSIYSMKYLSNPGRSLKQLPVFWALRGKFLPGDSVAGIFGRRAEAQNIGCCESSA
jgi:hypothetical protein